MILAITLDSTPPLLLGLVVVVVFSIVVEVGFYVGRKWDGKRGLSRYPVEAAIMTAVLGLFAFLIAFVFGSCASGYVKNRELALEEANAIETAYLRAGLLPDPGQRGEAQTLLLEYLQIRVDAVAANDPLSVANALSESTRIQGELWQLARPAVAQSTGPSIQLLFVSSLNQLFDNANKREWQALYTRLPPILWYTLAFLGLLCALMVGLSAGLHGRSSRFATSALLISFSVVIVLVIDLDRPFRSLVAGRPDPNAAVLKRLLEQQGQAPVPDAALPGRGRREQ